MQNLPIITATPVPPTQAPVATSNNTSQATEAFGNVLARQRANANTHASQEGNKSIDSKQSAETSATSANDAASAENNTSNQPASDPSASTLSGDMLVSLLSSNADSSDPAAKDKTDLQATTPDGTGTTPSDMLAMILSPVTASTSLTEKAPVDSALGRLLPANTNTEISAQQSIIPTGKKVGTQPLATVTLGETLQSTEKKALPEGSEPIPASGTSTGFESVLATAQKTFGKDGGLPIQLDTEAAKIQTQKAPVAATDSPLPGSISPIVANPGGAALAAQTVINTPVTDQAWGNEFNQKITWMATRHEQTAELHLNPPNLGPLDVVLKVSGDQATALFTSPHAAVRDAVEQALPQLRNMLADNGITLGNAMVSDQSPKDQQTWQTSQQQKGSGDTTGILDSAVATGSDLSDVTVASGRRHLGMVDTFA